MMWQKLIPQPKRLKVCIGSHHSQLNLTEALAGDVGTLVLGSPEVGLWTPNTETVQPGEKEYVCDLRFVPLTGSSTFERFEEAMKGKFLPAKFVLFKGDAEEKIELALQMFDYVFVPNKKLKNVAPFRSRVIGYQPPKNGLLNAPIIPDV